MITIDQDLLLKNGLKFMIKQETLPVASMAGVRIHYWQERSMSASDTPKEDTESLD